MASARKRPVMLLVLATGLAVAGCEQPSGQGPGHRSQRLALSPQQELALGREAYKEILSKARVLPASRPEVHRVRGVAERIVHAADIEPLQREINLQVRGYRFEWEVNVLESRQINAFCLPGGKMAVFSGILPVAENDDQLATVMSHEISHALAHHASERLARQQMIEHARDVIAGGMGQMNSGERNRFLGVLAAGAGLGAKSYDRAQESEADHIGLFLMTFAGYDPDEAVRFWRRMQQAAANQPRPPEILSDHPSDARRVAQLQAWVPYAKAAKKQFDGGRIAPPGR